MIEKPGPHKKQKTPKQKPPVHRYCRNCNIETGTECYRHYEGMFKHKYGKGWAVKVNDKLTSWLCDDCDRILSTKPDRDDYLACLEHDNEWMHLIFQTWLF